MDKYEGKTLYFSSIEELINTANEGLKELLEGGIMKLDIATECPECGHDYSRIVKCHALLGNDPSESLDGVPSGVALGGHSALRRGALVIRFDGECDHSWEMTFQQHKGRTLVWTEIKSPEDASD